MDCSSLFCLKDEVWEAEGWSWVAGSYCVEVEGLLSCRRSEMCRSLECDGWDKMDLAAPARELLSIPVIMIFWENLRLCVTRFSAFQQIWCH